MSTTRKLQRHHKFIGSSVLVSTLITAAASAMIGYGITKMLSIGIESINNQQIKMQAQQYAASRINVLRSVRYDNLSEMNKKQIGNTDYYEKVTKIGATNSSDSTKASDIYQVAIYKGSDSDKPVSTMNFSRSNPGVLLNNQVEGINGNADSSALIESALRNYTNEKFTEGSESESSNKAMGIKSFTSYVDGLLSKYRINAVAVDPFNQPLTSWNGVGDTQTPIYITKNTKYNYTTKGSVNYSMSGNSSGYLATLTKGADGLYYVDYMDKKDYFGDDYKEDTGGSSGGNTGDSGGSVSGGKTIPETETILDAWEADSGGMGIISTSNITIPNENGFIGWTTNGVYKGFVAGEGNADGSISKEFTIKLKKPRPFRGVFTILEILYTFR